MKAEKIDLVALKNADGYIIGTPNYFGAPSGYIKVFYDELFQEKGTKGKPVFCFVSHGGSGDISELVSMNNWLKMITVGNTVVVKSGNLSDKNVQDIKANLRKMLEIL